MKTDEDGVNRWCDDRYSYFRIMICLYSYFSIG
jgi:hypothetical protein